MDDAGQANITAQAMLNYDIARYCTPDSHSTIFSDRKMIVTR
jgi:hypothetical protein